MNKTIYINEQNYHFQSLLGYFAINLISLEKYAIFNIYDHINLIFL